MRSRRPGRLAVVLLAVAVALLACCRGGDGPTSSAAVPEVEAVATSTTSVAVRWTALADAHRWLVVLTGPGGRNLGQRTACGSCREQDLGHLAPGSTYRVVVLAIDLEDGFGVPSEQVEVTTPPEPACEAAEGSGCVVVDAGQPTGPATGIGLGLLHGVTTGTDPSAVAALEPLHWRVSADDPERIALARAYGAQVTAILSDAWIGIRGLQAPWVDWADYERFVGQVVDSLVASGLTPDHWEVQNEPGPAVYEGGEPATIDLVIEQHRRAAAQIRRRLPDAVVLGPGAAQATFGAGVTDLERYAELVADGTLDGLSWHEIGGGCLEGCDGSPRAVLQHVDDVREVLAAAGATGELHVDEWGAPWNIGQPGAAVGYLASMALAGVDAANATCWPAAEGESEPTCRVVPGTLDGLLLPDGRTPTDAWWAHVAYAQMTGPGSSALRAEVADPEASVFATVDGSGVIRALLGRHTACDRSADPLCPTGAAYGAPGAFSLVLDDLADGTYVVAVDRIASTDGASTGPEAVDAQAVEVVDGRLVAGPWEVADGDAVRFTITPAP